MQTQKLLFGIDDLLESHKFSHLHFALVTNNAATTADGTLSRIALLRKGINMLKLFSPEHGLTAQGEDGVFQKDSADAVTGLPVISLYGDQLRPIEEHVIDIDAILFDIPDVGWRFYTYLWTMTYIMEACAELNKPLFILDRPNLIGGDLSLAEGPMLDELSCSSFIGRWSIPVRHSCTLGELAMYFAATRVKDLDLKINTVQNWNRKQAVKDPRWFFTSPSPAIRDGETALLYPGMGLLEGINVNEGRGTDEPFKIFGAPWIHADQMYEAFNNLKLAGVKAHPLSYEPVAGLYSHEKCHGLQLNITDASCYRPVRMGLELINIIASLYPGHCKERLYNTKANPTGERHLDKLTGVYDSFKKIKNDQMADLHPDVSNWKETIDPYLLYA